MSADNGTYTEGRSRSPSHFGISYSIERLLRKTVGRISAIVRWSWWASVRDGPMMRSGVPAVGHGLERVLHRVPHRGEPSLGQVVQVDGDVGAGQERSGRVARLDLTLRRPGEDDVAHVQR